MAFQTYDKLQDIQGSLTPEGVAAVNMPLRRSYHFLDMTYSGVTLAQMSYLRLMINGRAEQTIKGADFLDVQNQFERAQAASGILRIPFERTGLLTRTAKESTIIGTGFPQDLNKDSDTFNPIPISTLSYEVEFAAGSFTPVLSFSAGRSEGRPVGQIRKINNFIYQTTGSGDIQIADLPRQDPITRMIFKPSANNITNVLIEADGFKAFDRNTAQNIKAQLEGVRDPQTGYWIVDFGENGYASEYILGRILQDLRITVTTDGAMSIDLQVETVGGLRG